MSGGGYRAETLELFDKFGGNLTELSDNIHGTGQTVNDMAGDTGLFGVAVGQIIGLAATKACAETAAAFAKFAGALEKHKEKLDKAKETYRAQEDDVVDTMRKFNP